MNQQTMKKTIQTIRTLGVFALLLSGAVFLIQGYMDWNGFERFVAFTGLNVLVGGLGLFCASVWKEPKGARTLLGLSAMGVSAQFAQLGGMIYSHWHKISEATHYNSLNQIPQILSQHDVGWNELLISFGLLAVIAPFVIKLTFRALAQNQGTLFMTLFAGSSLLLLSPVRQPWMVIVGFAFVAIFLFKKQKTGELGLKKNLTMEKWISLAIGLTPTLILLCRQLFYRNESISSLTLISLFFTLMAVVFKGYGYSKVKLQREGEEFEVITENHNKNIPIFPILVSWILVCVDLFRYFDLSQLWMGYLVSMSTILGVGALRKKDSMSEDSYKIICFLSLSGFTIFQLTHFGFTAGFMLMSAAALGTYFGYINREKALFNFSNVILCAAFVEIAIDGISWGFLASWINLGLIGIATILLASFLEKRLGQIKNWHAGLMNHF